MIRKHSFNIDNEPNWTNPIHIDSFEDETSDAIGELFGNSGISMFGENKLSKRKSEFETTSNKKSKLELGKDDSFANIIEVNDEGLLMNEEEIQALSDSFSDSFDEESGDDSIEGEYEINDDESNHTGKFADKKSRGNYACSKCGLPKRGHICVFQPRNRRRGGMIGPVDITDISSQQHLRIAENEVVPHPKYVPSGQMIRCDAQVGSDAAGTISYQERVSTGVSGPVMVSTGTQCALDIGGTVRELYLDAQGFPESYANGIIADPSFDVRTAKTITVSRPAPKSYKPKVTTASSGAGPDSAVQGAPAPLMVPPFVPAQSQRVLPAHINRSLDLNTNFLPSSSLPLPTGNLGNLNGLGNINANPLLSMNHLALLMNSYQLQNHSQVDEPIDPALASLFFPSSF